MDYKDFGLINTKDIFFDALSRHYAVPAFNFYNMETLSAIVSAAREKKSPVILAVSESALQYMGKDLLMGMIWGLKIKPTERIALHLDHGSSLESCTYAIKMGFSSIMIDGSKLPFKENIDLTKDVVNIAKKFNVSVEAELGTLSGIEDENISSEDSSYTNPNDVVTFVNATNADSLAIAIGTSHGAHKRKSDKEELRFDILEEISKELPNFPLVLHGASSIPQKYINTINEFGGNISNALGIPQEQIKKAVEMNVCKINVDSDSRLAFTAGVRKSLFKTPENFNPRTYLDAGMENIKNNCIEEIEKIMNSSNKIQ